MKAIKFNKKDFPFSSEEVNGWLDDNGGEPDGNTWLIPVDELPVNADLSFGEEVEVEEVEYKYDVEMEEWNGDFGSGDEWIGFQSTEKAYVVICK